MYMTHVCIIHSNTAFEAQLALLALGRVGNGMHVLILVAAVLLLPGELSIIEIYFVLLYPSTIGSTT